MIRLFINTALLAIVGAGGYWAYKNGLPLLEKNDATFSSETRLGEVTQGDITVTVTAAGTLKSAVSSSITPPYDGFVRKVYVKTGDHVQVGQPLISIAESTKSQEVFPLLAPFKGTVADVGVRTGEQVKAAQAADGSNFLLRIEDLSAFYCAADLPELDYVKVKSGLEAKVRVAALPDKIFAGKIQEIALAAKAQQMWERNKVVFGVRIKILDKDERLRPGMSVLADIVVAHKEKVLLLEHHYIAKTDEGFFVTRADNTRVKVELGLQNEMTAEIVSGLTAGERVRQVDFLSNNGTL